MTSDPPTQPERQLPATPADAAGALAALGLRVVPIAPGHQYPKGLPEWQRAATDDLATIQGWWDGPYQGHGVGIATGPGSGVWVIDVDVKDGKQGQDSLAQLVATHGRLPETVTTITGTGGYHIYFRWDPDRPPVTNFQEGAGTNHWPLGPGIDIRGAGGQVVAPPTIHPTGQPYRWATGRDPWNHHVADAPTWIYDLLHTPAPALPAAGPIVLPEPTGNGHHPPTFDEDSIAAWVRARHHWEHELQADGWTFHSHKPNGDTWWTRPGKNPRDGHSAVLHGPDGPLVIFTTEIPPQLAHAGARTADGSGISVSMFGYLAGMRHGGDRSGFARQQRTLRIDLERPATPPTAAVATAEEPAPAAGFVDLGDWWDSANLTRPADVCLRTDGVGLLYLDQLNWIHGDSTTGKTWILLHAMIQLTAAGRHVAWIHYEDPNPSTIVGRLKTLGAPRDDILARFHYYDPAGDIVDTAAFIALCEANDVVFVGLDSVGEALAAAGCNEDSDVEVSRWLNTGPRVIVNAGIGFCGIDHGTKAGTQKLHPSGSKRKRAALTGTNLFTETITSPTVAQDGAFRITCAKDRHGNHAQGAVVGIAHFRHNITGNVDLTITPPSDGGDTTADPDKWGREVVRAVTDNPGLSKSKLLPFLPTAGRAKRLDAINDAIKSGLITATPGPGGAELLYPLGHDDG